MRNDFDPLAREHENPLAAIDAAPIVNGDSNDNDSKSDGNSSEEIGRMSNIDLLLEGDDGTKDTTEINAKLAQYTIDDDDDDEDDEDEHDKGKKGRDNGNLLDDYNPPVQDPTNKVGLSGNAGMWSYALQNHKANANDADDEDGDAPRRQQMEGRETNGVEAHDNAVTVFADAVPDGTVVLEEEEPTAGRRGIFGWGGRSRANDPNDPNAANDPKALGGAMQGQEDLLDDIPASATGGFFRRRSNAVNSDANSDANSATNNATNNATNKSSNLSYSKGNISEELGSADLTTEEMEEQQEMDNELRPGDHIYVWQTYGINPRAYQRHAVVYSVTRKGYNNKDNHQDNNQDNYQDNNQDKSSQQLSYNIDNLYKEDLSPASTYTDDRMYDPHLVHPLDIEVTVVSFYHYQRHAAQGAAQAATAATGNRRGKRSGCKLELLHDFIGPDGLARKKPVHKVRYGRQLKKGLLSQKASVGTALKKDQVGLILARVRYLLDHADHLPDHNALSANGECAAMWCITGRWCTLQGASILQITSVGQAGGALLAGGILSNLTVLVPMPGIWGMAGWWWYVPATVAYPFLVPMLVALGMASLVPLEILRRNRKKWRGITDGLNHEFWLHASEEVKEEYFGVMATAEKEAEMRSFFGVRENDNGAEDARYMPVGAAPNGINDDSDDDDDDSDFNGTNNAYDEDEAKAMQEMEKNCQTMAMNMNVDLSGKPPERTASASAWGNFMGSFRRNANKEMTNGSKSLRQIQKQGEVDVAAMEREGIIS